MASNNLEQLLQPTIEDMGYVMWGCEIHAQGKHSLVRIYIDSVDGIQIDDCERVSHQVSAILDVEDPIAGEYRLEISSPGIPRPLFYPHQYASYIGQEVSVRLFRALNGQKKFVGVIEAADDDAVTLKIDQDVTHRFLFSDIVKAILTVE